MILGLGVFYQINTELRELNQELTELANVFEEDKMEPENLGLSKLSKIDSNLGNVLPNKKKEMEEFSMTFGFISCSFQTPTQKTIRLHPHFLTENMPTLVYFH